MLLSKLYIIITMLVISACGSQEPQDSVVTDSQVIWNTLQQKYNDYCIWSISERDSWGFIKPRGDSLLFTSLHEVGCQSDVNIDKAALNDGRLCRHPDCMMPTKSGDDYSSSLISRDMIVGRIILAHERQDVAFFERFIAYGEANNWYMCGDDGYATIVEYVSECRVTAGLRYLIYLAADDVGYVCDLTCEDELNNINLIDPFAEGYKAHLAMLQLYLRGEVRGLTEFEKYTVKFMAYKEQDNALFQAIAYKHLGDQEYKDRFISSMSNEQWFPKSHLPTSDDRCEPHLFQRNHVTNAGVINTDWIPCTNQHYAVHPGTDYLFAWYVMNQGK